MCEICNMQEMQKRYFKKILRIKVNPQTSFTVSSISLLLVVDPLPPSHLGVLYDHTDQPKNTVALFIIVIGTHDAAGSVGSEQNPQGIQKSRTPAAQSTHRQEGRSQGLSYQLYQIISNLLSYKCKPLTSST